MNPRFETVAPPRATPPPSKSATFLPLIAVLVMAVLFVLLMLSLLSDSPGEGEITFVLIAGIALLAGVSVYFLATRRSRRAAREYAARLHNSGAVSSGTKKPFTGGAWSHTAALRAVQRQSDAAHFDGANPEEHYDAYRLAKQYLEQTDEMLRLGNVVAEKRVAMMAGQERIRALQKKHLLVWARETARNYTNEAHLKARMFDKIETANQAITVIRQALEVYPQEAELRASETAVREFVTSVKVAHWIELAERAAFKGNLKRAIDRYQDALFYLSREPLADETRVEIGERIAREIGMLRARRKVGNAIDELPARRRPRPEK